MSTIKCPHCELVSFSSARYCIRCGTDLAADGAQTQILNAVQPTEIRPTAALPQTDSGNYPPPAQTYSPGYSLPRFPEEMRPVYGMQLPPQPAYYPAEVAYKRAGTEIALHQNAMLPQYCVKCARRLGFGDGAVINQKMRWHHPAVYIAVISPLIYIILAAALSKRFSVDVPLCNEHLTKRKNTGRAISAASLAFLALTVAAFGVEWVGTGFILIFAWIMTVIIGIQYSYKPLRVKRVEGPYYYLEGASEEFLSILPH